MPFARIRIYEEGWAKERLVEERRIPVESAKRLTKGRAAKILARAYPQLKIAGRVMLIDTPRGWSAIKSVSPTDKCSFHYIWHRFYVSKELEEEGPETTEG